MKRINRIASAYLELRQDHRDFQPVLTIDLQSISNIVTECFEETVSSRVVADVGLARLITEFDDSGRQLGIDHHHQHQDLMRMMVSTLLSGDLQGCSGFYGVIYSC